MIIIIVDYMTKKKWQEQHFGLVIESYEVTIIWDFTIHTDRHIKANQLNIVIKDHKRKWFLIDLPMPSDKNISVKEPDKISKYKDIEIENYVAL